MDNSISFSVSMADSYSSAVQQNNIPIISNVTVTNTSDKELSGLKLRISSDPEFTDTFYSDIFELSPSQSYDIPNASAEVFSEILLSLSRRIEAKIRFDILAGEGVIASEERTVTLLPAEGTEETDEIIPTDSREVTKQVLWERKLLDLSLRNSLLNFRPNASSLQLLTSSLGKLEDEMSNNEEFRIMPASDNIAFGQSENKTYLCESEEEKIADITDDDFKSRRLRSFLSESELEKIMKKLHRQAKVSIEENGANTIYLALGFLRWYESEKAEKPRYAPIVLVPVDIIRKVQGRSYSIRMRDEETQINITIIEMLRQTFGIEIKGLDPVPLDESGVDLPLILDTFRQAVSAYQRWGVEELAFVGQFSFSRFIMWNDIRSRSDELAKNKVVASLLSGKLEWSGEDLYISPLDLDNKVKPSDLAVPLSADSSQLAAVYAASQGKSFVLHGPPGSGKSQTITNMIASALYQGKSVLFVAEKMAALSVVEKRLNKVGLGPFCLELHSNKAQKRAVLKQLEDTLNIGKIKSPAEYKAKADKICDMRKELNSTMEELHKRRNFGFSVYDAAVRYEKYKDFGGKLEFTREQLDSMSESSYTMWHETLEALSAAGKEFGDVSDAPLAVCEIDSVTPETRNAFEKKLNEFKNVISKADKDFSAVCSFTGTEKMSYEQCRAAAEIIASSSADGTLIAAAADTASWQSKREGTVKIISCGKEMTALQAEVLEKFEPSVLGYDSSDALVRWKTADSKWFIPKHFGKKKLVTELAAHAKSRDSVNKENLVSHYEKLNKLSALKKEIEAANPNIKESLGKLWNGENTDWNALEKSVEKSEKLGAMIDGSPFDSSQKKSIISSLASADIPSVSAFDSVEKTVDELAADFGIIPEKLLSGENWMSDASQKADGIIASLPQLKEWSGIIGLCKKLRGFGIGNVAEAYLSGKIQSSELTDSFDADISKAAITATISRSKELADFNGTLFEDTVRRFGEVLDNFSELSIKELAAELSAKIPTPGSSANSSEIGILQKAIKSGGRMMSIRKLFDSIPNLLRRMCPVMLMSPISVAQYIDPAYPKFDLVIFDEASQLPTCEAVGAIARGENVIVVGDPRQLPPTSFFSANQTDEENYDIEDLESVLDDCLALSMPQKHLLWHYRSRHESLIAYSNAKYYENKLYTFPSPDDQHSMVSWVHVDGCYDKSSTRTNKAEAQAVVDEICRRLSDEKLRRQSIGVVTFSQPQQNLVDDLLTDAFIADPQLEEWANGMYEPILIKNLENVQGDERDVIMFTIGYGPDKDGKLSMNFGPLNRDGGWRRLNVAISRSKCEMIVFSTITPDMIDLSRTRSDGVEGLKGFLEFAAKGRSALPARSAVSAVGSGFEAVAADEIRKMGYECKCNVGCSDYKIDIAVIDPDSPDSYILGINCGSEANYRNGTASDRTLSQPSVLKGLGWNVMNVYILDWLDNKEKSLARIRAEIEKALEKKKSPSPEPEPAKPKKEIVFETEEVRSFDEDFETYTPYQVKKAGEQADFTEANTAKVTKCINEILKAEAPISKKLLAKKVHECFGIARAGSNIKSVFDSALSMADAETVTHGEGEYVWIKGQDRTAYDICRIVPKDAQRRDIEDIAPEETAVGIKRIMSRQIAMTRDDLLREIAHLFGYSRITPSIETAAAFGIKSAKNSGWIEFSEDGRIKISK